MKIPTFLILMLSITVFAGDKEPAEESLVGHTIECSVATNGNQIVLHFHDYTTGSNWTEDAGPVPISLPYAYKDPESGIVFYVESDGRHVSAINPEGKVLWSRDPFADAHLPLYRTDTPPRIVFIGRKRGKVEISFDSTQFGTLNIKTGDFTFLGQN